MPTSIFQGELMENFSSIAVNSQIVLFIYMGAILKADPICSKLEP